MFPTLASLLSRWQSARERGESPSAEQLCHDCPHLVEGLARVLRELERVDDLLSSMQAGQVTLAPVTDDQDRPIAPSPPGYEILRELGRGGMGVVYMARQVALNRVVALKMILAGGHTSSDDRARFLAEAEAFAAVRHVGIVEVYEYGMHEGLPFFALEYCDGGSLAERLREGPLSPGEAARLLEQVARAMQAAHDKGIVHRDLKPANVLLSEPRPLGSGSPPLPNGRGSEATPKVTDFGLAKRIEGAPTLTRTGSILGTPSYMAPEQAEGKKSVSPAADVWALGAVLYECLTGRPPFQAATALDTILQVISDEPAPPRRLNATLPRDLETIALKCLEKPLARRYANAADLAEDLRRWQAGEPILARPAAAWERAAKWARRNPVVAGLLAALSLALALAAYFAVAAASRAAMAEDWAKRAEANEVEARAQTARAEREEAVAREQTDRAERELGRAEWLVYARQIEVAQRAVGDHDGAAARLALNASRWDLRGWEHRHLSALLARNQRDWRRGNQSESGVAYSPDGRLLAGGGGEGRIKVWDAVTGKELLTFEGRSALAFSPDSRRLAGKMDENTVAVWDARTGRKAFQLAAQTVALRAAAFSPDGAFFATAGGKDPGEVKVWDARDGRLRFDLIGHTSQAAGAAFSPDGSRLVSAGLDEMVREWDVRTGQPIRAWRGHDGEINGIAYSPDGETFATAGDDETVRVWDAGTTRELLTLRGHVGMVLWVSYSPDGARLASAGADSTVRLWDVRTGRETAILVGHAGPVWHVAFRPDGSRLASTAENGALKVWDVRPERAVAPAWRKAGFETMAMTPAGDRIATYTDDAVVRVREVGSGRELFQLLKQGNSLEFSPDGKRLATSFGRGQTKLWDAWTGKELLTLRGRHGGGPWGFAFSPDGTRLATAGGKGDEAEPVKVWDARTGELLHDLKGHTDQVLGIAFAPDGRRLASVCGARVVFVWDAREGKQLLRLENGRWSVAFSPDGSRLVSGGRDQTATVWDVQTGRVLLTLRGHTGGVVKVGWSPDGSRIATGASEGAVRLWHADRGYEVMTFRRPATNVWSVAFSADGARLAAAGRGNSQQTQSRSGWLDVWDAPGEREPLPLLGYRAPLRAAAFTAAGDRIVARDNDDKLVAWDALTGRLVKDYEGPFPPGGRMDSPDGQYRLEVSEGAARLVPRGYVEPDRHAPPDPAWHRERAAHFERTGDAFAAVFHLDRLLAAIPGDRPALLSRRALILTDASATEAILLLRARGAVVAPSLDKERHHLLPAVSRLAEARNTPLPLRVKGGLQLRAGEPMLAIRSLEAARALRPAGSPPIEELLLALAHAALGQHDAARRLASVPAASDDTFAASDSFSRVEYELLREEVRRQIGDPR